MQLQSLPVDGNANQALIRRLLNTLGVSKAALRIQTGSVLTLKRIELDEF